MTIRRTCCCQGCYDNDDCPVAYTGLGDFTYTASIDTAAIAGNFSLSAITDIQLNPQLEGQAGYMSAYDYPFCCDQSALCNNGPIAAFVEKYWDRMGPAILTSQKTNYPCYTVISSAKQLPLVVYSQRCTDNKRFTVNACTTLPRTCACPGPLGEDSQDSTFYALLVNPPPPGYSLQAGEWSADVEPAVNFGALTVGSGQLLIRRNSQSTFQVTLSSGSNVNSMSYRHRENICDGPATDCGPCTQPVGGSGGIPCSAGRCCCRSTLRFTFTVSRVVYPITYVWNSFTHDFDRTQGSPVNWTQSVVCIYEGPVDQRLYQVTGTSTLRTFTLLAAYILDDTPGPSRDLSVVSNDYCPWDTFGDPLSTGVGTSIGPSVVSPTSIVDDECEPCVSAIPSPPAPAVLSMEQAERLGIKRLITVTRTTP